MIISDISQIDRWAGELFDKPSNIISIEMKNYFTLRDASALVKAIKYDFQELSDEDIASINAELREVRQGKVCGLLLFFNDSKATPLTVGQMGLFSDVLQRHIDTDNIIWGVGEGDNHIGTILVVVGYSA